MPHLFRSFLPLENPVGFGYQDFLELGFALLLVSLAFVRPVRAFRWLGSPFVSLLIAMGAAHFLFAWWTHGLLHSQASPRAVEKRFTPAKKRPVNTPATKPLGPVEKPVSPFEEVRE